MLLLMPLQLLLSICWHAHTSVIPILPRPRQVRVPMKARKDNESTQTLPPEFIQNRARQLPFRSTTWYQVLYYTWYMTSTSNTYIKATPRTWARTAPPQDLVMQAFARTFALASAVRND